VAPHRCPRRRPPTGRPLRRAHQTASWKNTSGRTGGSFLPGRSSASR
jgi:hypothetical protein